MFESGTGLLPRGSTHPLNTPRAHTHTHLQSYTTNVTGCKPVVSVMVNAALFKPWCYIDFVGLPGQKPLAGIREKERERRGGEVEREEGGSS